MMGWMAPLYHFNVLLPSRPGTSLSAFTVFSLATGTTVWGCVWSLWGWGRSLGGSCCFTLSGNVFIQRVETFGFWAIKVEPPITDEVFLVKDGSVGAEEGVFGKASKTIGCAYVECLAVSFGVGIVSWELYWYFNNVVIIKCLMRYIYIYKCKEPIYKCSYLLLLGRHRQMRSLVLQRKLGSQFLVVLGQTSRASQDLDGHHLRLGRLIESCLDPHIQLGLGELRSRFQLLFVLVWRTVLFDRKRRQLRRRQRRWQLQWQIRWGVWIRKGFNDRKVCIGAGRFVENVFIYWYK